MIGFALGAWIGANAVILGTAMWRAAHVERTALRTADRAEQAALKRYLGHRIHAR